MTEHDNTTEIMDEATPHIERLIALTRRVKDDPTVTEDEFDAFAAHVDALKDLRDRATLPGLKAGLDQSLAELTAVIDRVRVQKP